MSRFLVFALWFSMMVGVLAGLHYYFWARLVRDPFFAQPWRGILTGAIVLLAVSIPLTFFIGRAVGSPWRELLAWPAFVWMGTMFLLFVVLVGVDVTRLVVMAFHRLTADAPDAVDTGRRLLLARSIAGGSAIGAFGLAAVAVRGGVKGPVLERVKVQLARLPAALDGFRIVQISDLHVGPTIGHDYVRDVVDRTNAEAPDVIAITGDLVVGGVGELEKQIAPLKELRAKYGVYFVTGNHEYYAGVEHWVRALSEMGVRVLRNERVSIGDGEESFDLAGVDDYGAGRMRHGHGPDLAKAVDGRDPNRELILLAHQPKEISRAAEHGVGLQLSGHTHGGQIWPFGFFVRLAQPYVAGLYRHGVSQIYVNRGTGYWGPPMRLGNRSELTLLELQSKAAGLAGSGDGDSREG